MASWKDGELTPVGAGPWPALLSLRGGLEAASWPRPAGGIAPPLPLQGRLCLLPFPGVTSLVVPTLEPEKQ